MTTLVPALLPEAGVSLAWLDTVPPAFPGGVTWGIPWPRNAVPKGQQFTLTEAGGQTVPVQSWPLAFWPDGSLKWTGHAAVACASAGEVACQFRLTPAKPGQTDVLPATPVRITETADAVTVDTGTVQCRLPRSGSAFIEALTIAGRVVAEQGHLVCLREDRSRSATEQIVREETFLSRIAAVTVEQAGPVCAVVKITGTHASATHASANRNWLPFTIRLRFYLGTAAITLIHSFVFDGDQEKDFIRGLGIRFAVPLRDEFHNRHVRLSGEGTGLFAEPIQLLAGRRNPTPDLYARQLSGQAVPKLADLPGKENVAQMAVWDGFKLTQTTADSFTLQKRTGSHSAWITAYGGKRATGLAFVGDTTGGFSVGMKDFWRLHPTMLEIQGASTPAAQLTVWLWSPDSPAMDMRHYDVVEHGLEASYEDIEPGFSTAHGIARTTELTLCPFAQTPPHANLLALAAVASEPPHLVCTPEWYHAAGAFGIWSLPDRVHPGKRWIEEQLDQAIAFYQGQIEQRRWYGFWDFGDVMHSYDPARHQWRYDVGGFAWANTELMPDLWLWYSFLRSGRADIFRMAEAMTRHTQEVDVYHLGAMQGLGSRHNVRHWGCGAKEARIGQALLKRFYYYLTADERTGDLLDEVTNADFQTVAVDPLRKIETKGVYPTHARVGPDWFAYCSNWLAAWERTGDTRWRDKIIVGMNCMAAMPHKLFSGFAYGYDPETGKLHQLHDNVEVPHLAALMGGPELCMELTPLIGLPAWSEAWLHYCHYLQAPADEQKAALGGATVDNCRGSSYARMTAYAAAQTGSAPELAQRAWNEYLKEGRGTGPRFTPRRYAGPDVPFALDEAPHVSTNSTAQWCLNAIQILALVGDQMPDSLLPP